MSFKWGCWLKGFERKSGTDNVPAAAVRKLASRHWLKNKGTSLMFPVVLMKN